MPDVKKVASIEKNSETQIQFGITEYREAMYVDVREHLETDTYKGPTKKGLRFNSDLLDQMIDGLNAVKRALAGEMPPEEEEAGEEEAGEEEAKEE